jgi:hypothetical protein
VNDAPSSAGAVFVFANGLIDENQDQISAAGVLGAS